MRGRRSCFTNVIYSKQFPRKHGCVHYTSVCKWCAKRKACRRFHKRLFGHGYNSLSKEFIIFFFISGSRLNYLQKLCLFVHLGFFLRVNCECHKTKKCSITQITLPRWYAVRPKKYDYLISSQFILFQIFSMLINSD